MFLRSIRLVTFCLILVLLSFVFVCHFLLHIAVVHLISLLCDILLGDCYNNLFIHFIVEEHVGYVQFGAIKNNSTLNIFIHVFWWRCAFFPAGSAVSEDILRFNFDKYCQMPMVAFSIYTLVSIITFGIHSVS